MIFYFIFPIVYLLIFISAEILYQHGLDGKITRKIDHVGGGIVSLFLPLLTSVTFTVILGTVVLCLIAFSQKNKLLKSLNNKSNIEFGAITFPISIVLSTIIWYNNTRDAFYVAVLVMSLADSFGCLLGYYWGNRYKIKKFNKTMLGSLSFFIITTSIFCFFVWPINLAAIPWIIFAGLIITVVELVTPFGLDNLTVPIVSGAIYTILQHLL